MVISVEKLKLQLVLDNLIPHRVDLTANDGLKDYASCVDKVSLMTVDNYRRYREFLPTYGKWWCLATAFSAESNGYSRTVCYVLSSGAVDWCGCDCSYGIRPFCIFSSDIVVTPIEE